MVEDEMKLILRLLIDVRFRDVTQDNQKVSQDLLQMWIDKSATRCVCEWAQYMEED